MVIFRVENGVDQVIKITSEYERSCYGMSIEDLVNATTPVRYLPPVAPSPSSLEASSAPASAPFVPKLGVPKELWVLVDALWSSGGIQAVDLFYTQADHVEVAQVREALDVGTDIPSSCSPYAIGEALTTLLASFAVPVIPYESFPPVHAVHPRSSKKLYRLPPYHTYAL